MERQTIVMTLEKTPVIHRKTLEIYPSAWKVTFVFSFEPPCQRG